MFGCGFKVGLNSLSSVVAAAWVLLVLLHASDISLNKMFHVDHIVKRAGFNLSGLGCMLKDLLPKGLDKLTAKLSNQSINLWVSFGSH
jgi:hypothetical protein